MPVQSFLPHAVITGAFQKGWQGPTLAGCLRGITPAQALKRPGKGRKCIWEQVLHAAYWKYAVTRILMHAADPAAAEAMQAFPRSPSNWPRLPEVPDAKAWKRDIALLKQCQYNLEAVVESLADADLSQRPSLKHKHTLAFYIAGAAAHDAYHTGQIQLLKRLWREPEHKGRR
ncbi:MAG TPA: DinB family protein [Phycisphaerales bacterium]|nr:DinB family protein [Phycisphaerales bacterium]